MAKQQSLLDTGPLDPLSGLTPLKESGLVFNPTGVKWSNLSNTSTPIEQPGLNIDQFKDYWGDTNIPVRDDLALEEQRSQRQSAGEQLLHGLGKMGITAAATALDGVIGTAVGLVNVGKSIAEGESARDVFGAFVDNPVSKFLNGLLTAQEQWLPNYQTQAGQDNPFYKQMFGIGDGAANFWGDSFLKNMGFTIGMAFDGVLTGAVLGARSARLAGKVLQGIVGKADETGKIIRTTEDALKAVKKGTVALTDMSEDLQNAAKQMRRANLTTQTVASTVATFGEARMEALNQMGQWDTEKLPQLNQEWADNLPQLTEEVKKQILGQHPEMVTGIPSGDGRVTFQPNAQAQQLISQKIEELHKQKQLEYQNARTAMGNMIFGLNVAILSPSNFIQFRNAFSGGFKFNRANWNRFIAGEGTAGQAPTAGIGKIGIAKTAEGVLTATAEKTPILTKIGKSSVNALTEGQEEMSQQVIQSMSDDFYSHKVNPSAKQDENNLFHSLLVGLQQGYGTEKGWEQFFIGALTGALGTPAPATNLKGVQWAGGAWAGISEARHQDAKTQAIATKLTGLMNTPEFKNYYDGAVRDISYQYVKKASLQTDNQLAYENAAHSQLVNTVVTFAQAGKIQDLLDNFEGMQHITDAQQIRDMTMTKDKDGKPVDLYKNVDDATLVKRFHSRAEELITNTKEIASLKDDIDTHFPKASENAKQELLYNASMARNAEDRLGQLENNLNSLTRPRGNAVATKALDKMHEILADENHYDDPKLQTELVKNAKTYTDEYSYIKSDAHTQAQDYVKLIKQRQTFADKYTAMTTDEGLTKQEKKIAKKEAAVEKQKVDATLEPLVGQWMQDDAGKQVQVLKNEAKGTYYTKDQTGNTAAIVNATNFVNNYKAIAKPTAPIITPVTSVAPVVKPIAESDNAFPEEQLPNIEQFDNEGNLIINEFEQKEGALPGATTTRGPGQGASNDELKIPAGPKPVVPTTLEEKKASIEKNRKQSIEDIGEARRGSFGKYKGYFIVSEDTSDEFNSPGKHRSVYRNTKEEVADYLNNIYDKQLQVLETTTPEAPQSEEPVDSNKPTPTEDTQDNPEASERIKQLRPSAVDFLKHLGGNIRRFLGFNEETGKPKWGELTRQVDQRRYFKAVRKLNTRTGEYYVKLHTGLQLFDKESWPKVKAYAMKNGVLEADADNILYAVVVDAKGNRVLEDGEPIYTTIQLPNPFAGKNKKYEDRPGTNKATPLDELARIIEATDAIAQDTADKHKDVYNNLLARTQAGEDVQLRITGKTQGVLADSKVFSTLEEVFTEKNGYSADYIQNLQLRTATAGIVHFPGKDVPGSAGRVYMMDTNGNLYQGQRRHRLNTDEISTIVDVFQAMAAQSKPRTEVRGNKEVAIIGTKDSMALRHEDGTQIKITKLTLKEKKAASIWNLGDILTHFIRWEGNQATGAKETIGYGKEPGYLNVEGQQILAYEPDVDNTGCVLTAEFTTVLNDLLGRIGPNIHTDLNSGTQFVQVNKVTVNDKGQAIVMDADIGKAVTYEEFVKDNKMVTLNLEPQQRTYTIQSEDSTGKAATHDVTETEPYILNQNLTTDYTIKSVDNISTTTNAGEEASDYRIATDTFQGPEDFAKAEAEVKRMFGNKVSWATIKGLIDGKAWGTVGQAAIYISENAEVGTTYHEAFHILVNQFLSQEDTNSMESEYKKLNPADKDLTTRQVVEKLCEQFRDYKLGREVKGNFIQRMFKRIANGVENIVAFLKGDKSSIQKVFKLLNSGYFATRPIHTALEVGQLTYAGKDAGWTNHTMKSMSTYFFDYIFNPKNISTYHSLFSGKPNGTEIGLIYQHIHDSIKAYRDTTTPTRKSYQQSVTELTAIIKRTIQQQTDLEKYESLVANIDYILDNFQELIKFHQENELINYKLEIIDLDSRSEEDKVKDSAAFFNAESIKSSAKETANNQIKLLIASLPAMDSKRMLILNEYGLPENVDYGSEFSLLVNTLSGMMTLTEMEAKLNGLVGDHPEIYNLLNRLNSNTAIENVNSVAMNLRMQFFSSFCRNQWEYYMDLVGEGNTSSTIDATSNRLANKIFDIWQGNANRHRLEPKFKQYYKDNKDKTGYIYNSDAFKLSNYPAISDFPRALELLEKLGIHFTRPQSIVEKSIVISLAENIRSAIARSTNTALIFDNRYNKEFGATLKVLQGIEARTRPDNIENAHYNLDNELVYNAALNSFVSGVKNVINIVKTKAELYERLPWLNPYNENGELVTPYLQNSLLLGRAELSERPGMDGVLFDKYGNKKDGAAEIVYAFHEGSKEQSSGETETFNGLKPADKLRARINNGFNGRYHMLRAADNALERIFGFGNPLLSQQMIASSMHLTYLTNFLNDELDRAEFIATFKGSDPEIQYRDANSNNGILISLMLSDYNKPDTEGHNHMKDNLKELIKQLSDPKTYPDAAHSIDVFIEQQESAIHKVLTNYITSRTDTLYAEIQAQGLIGADIDGRVVNYALAVDDKFMGSENGMDATTVKALLQGFYINDMLFGIEQTKLFTGDPISFKSVEDMFKRISSAVSTKKAINVDPTTNYWFQKYMGGDDLAYKEYPVTRTAVIADIISRAEFLDDYDKLTPAQRKAYETITESDGQGYILLSKAREMFFRSGDWTFGQDSMEELYQWIEQRANAVKTYVDPKDSTITWEIKQKPSVVLKPMKLQYNGPRAEDGYQPTIYKFAVMPMDPTLTEGLNIDKLRLQMEANNIGIVTFGSGNKIGATLVGGEEVDGKWVPGKIQPVLMPNGTISSVDLVTQDTYTGQWGIQLDMGTHPKLDVVTGTQMTKQILSGLFEDGKAVKPQFDNIVNEYHSLMDKRIELGMRKLINRLGLKALEGGSYVLEDGQKLKDILTSEAKRRNLPTNIIEGLDWIDKGNGIDVLVNREKVEQMLFKIADVMTISQHTYGNAAVQVSAAMMEADGITRESINGKPVLTSQACKFYRKTVDGKSILAMQVMVASHYEGTFTLEQLKAINPKLAEVIGFRIPTQGPNSIEAIEIVKFLSPNYGDTIVVPSELVAKAGSDFDVDKLNLYFANFFYDIDGNPQYIEYKSDEKLRKDYDLAHKPLDKILDKYSPQAIHEFWQAKQANEDVGFNTKKDMVDKLTRVSAFLTAAKDTKLADELTKLSKELDSKLTNWFSLAGMPTFEDYQFKAVENRIHELQREILLDLDNMGNVMAPLVVDDLESVANWVYWLQNKKPGYKKDMTREEEYAVAKAWAKNKDESTPLYQAVDTQFILDIGNKFQTGVSAVAITALNSTFAILAQHNNLSMLNGDIKLLHNSKNIVQKLTAEDLLTGEPSLSELDMLDISSKSQTQISLSHLTTNEGLDKDGNRIKGQNIPYLLSQWINAAVDAAKNPFMFRLGADLARLNTFLYLTMAGVPTAQTALLMSQPLVKEYIRRQTVNESMIAEENKTSTNGLAVSKNELIKKLLQDNGIRISGKLDATALGQLSNGSIGGKITEDMLIAGLTESTFSPNQVGFLVEFLTYQDQAKALNTVIQSLSLDTNAAGSTVSEMLLKLFTIKQLLKEPVVSNYSSLIGADLNDLGQLVPKASGTFIAPYFRAVHDLQNVFAPLTMVLRQPMILQKINDWFEIAAEQKAPRKAAIKMINLFKQDMLTYLFFTTEFNYSGMTHKLEDDKQELFYGDKKFTNDLVAMQEKHPNNKFLQALFEVSIISPVIPGVPEEGEAAVPSPSCVGYHAAKLNAIESEELTANWSELMSEGLFGLNLFKVGLMQSGFQNSPSNFLSLMPSDVFNNIANQILTTFNNLAPDIQNAAVNNYNTQFDNNNYGVKQLVNHKIGNSLVNTPKYQETRPVNEEAAKMTKAERATARKEGGIIKSTFPKIFGKHGLIQMKYLGLADYVNKLTLKNYSSKAIEESRVTKTPPATPEEVNAVILPEEYKGTKVVETTSTLQSAPTGKSDMVYINPETIAKNYRDKEWRYATQYTKGRSTPLSKDFKTIEEYTEYSILKEIERNMQPVRDNDENFGQYWDRINNAAVAKLTNKLTKPTANVETSSTKMTTVDKTESWAQLKDVQVYANEDQVMVMRKQNTNQHFGNPFTASVSGLFKVVSIDQAVNAYKDWLSGLPINTIFKKYGVKDETNPNNFSILTDLEERRQWILSQIDQGNLDGKELLYMNDKGEYYSHADALADFVNRRSKTSSTTVTTPAAKSNGITFQEDKFGAKGIGDAYKHRRYINAGADMTIAIALDFSTPGEKGTRTDVLAQKKEFIAIHYGNEPLSVDNIVERLNSLGKFEVTINFAGNAIDTFSRNKVSQETLDTRAYQLLYDIVNSPNLTTKIAQIVSGGQTGIDEAGAKAGMQLGIPTTIIAPEGWLFRDATGRDISNEQQFKARFDNIVNPADTQTLDEFKDTNNIC